MTTIQKGPATGASGTTSLVPARIDRLGWSSFHTRLLVALGVAWILDGLEILEATTPAALSPLSRRSSASSPSRGKCFRRGPLRRLA